MNIIIVLGKETFKKENDQQKKQRSKEKLSFGLLPFLNSYLLGFAWEYFIYIDGVGYVISIILVSGAFFITFSNKILNQNKRKVAEMKKWRL
jgi:hypothetical protein